LLQPSDLGEVHLLPSNSLKTTRQQVSALPTAPVLQKIFSSCLFFFVLLDLFGVKKGNFFVFA
jgi:hypothetical protein